MESLSKFINEKILINKNSKYEDTKFPLYETWKQLIPNLEEDEFYEVFDPYIKNFSNIIIYSSYITNYLLVKKGFYEFKTIPYKEIAGHDYIATAALNSKKLKVYYEGSFDNLTIIVREDKNNIMTVSYNIDYKTIATIVIEWK